MLLSKLAVFRLQVDCRLKHTRESPSEYSEEQYWSTLMYVVLKSLSCLQFKFQTASNTTLFEMIMNLRRTNNCIRLLDLTEMRIQMIKDFFS